MVRDDSVAATVVKTIRVSAEAWAFVEARAKAKGVTANAWVGRCIEDARKRMDK